MSELYIIFFTKNDYKTIMKIKNGYEGIEEILEKAKKDFGEFQPDSEVAFMHDLMLRKENAKAVPQHGQAIFQLYFIKTRTNYEMHKTADHNCIMVYFDFDHENKNLNWFTNGFKADDTRDIMLEVVHHTINLMKQGEDRVPAQS